jgi:hypothetical protein
LLQQEAHPNMQEPLQQLRLFLQRSGKTLSEGGIHTPNHRWVICVGLAWLYRIFGEEKYRQRIDNWLAEGIDQDPDGQFHEKSTYIYSPVCDRVFLTMARLLNRPELLDVVRKNLEMTLYYLRPNGEVVTENSGRQDQSMIGFPYAYYYPYRYFAIRDGNGQFAEVCRRIETQSIERLPAYLNYLLEDEEVQKPLPATAPLPENYFKVFRHSNLARIRRGKLDATIMSGNSIIFSLHKGNAVLQGLRFASSFFGKGQFIGKSLEQEGNVMVLNWEAEGPYYQLYPENLLPDDGDWGKMDRQQRPKTEVQRLQARVGIEEREGKFQIAISVSGTDRVPLALELSFRRNGVLSQVTPVDGIADAFLAKGNTCTFTCDDQVISFGPGRVEHSWTQLRGAFPKMDGQAVYLTGFTPFEHKLEIS